VVRCVAVIPARGGSKGVPLKNVAPIAGTTLLDLAIDSARGAAAITDIVVSTDHPTIAERARARDVIVIDRPAALAGACVSIATSRRRCVNSPVIRRARSCRCAKPSIIR